MVLLFSAAALNDRPRRPPNKGPPLLDLDQARHLPPPATLSPPAPAYIDVVHHRARRAAGGAPLLRTSRFPESSAVLSRVFPPEKADSGSAACAVPQN